MACQYRTGEQGEVLSPEMGAGPTTCARQDPVHLHHHRAIRTSALSLFSPMSSTSTDRSGMAQFRDKDRAALYCNAALRARTDATTPKPTQSTIDQRFQPRVLDQDVDAQRTC